MKKTSIIICLFLFSLVSMSQSVLDNALSEASSDIATKLTKKGISKLVVLYITDINKAPTTAGKYMADVISNDIVNNEGNFLVFDRENLSEIAEANKLINEGYVNAAKAKELGEILAVETIIIGNYTVLSSTLKLTLKAMDVNSGFVIASTMKDLPINEDIGSLLGIGVSGASNSATSRGFNNRPVQSNESYNNPETVDVECETNNTGDYCFENQTNESVIVYFITYKYENILGQSGSSSKLTLQPGQTQCAYNLKIGNYKYGIRKESNKPKTYRDQSNFEMQGQFLIEQCKSKTFIIK